MIKESNLDNALKELHSNIDSILISYSQPDTEEILKFDTTDVWISVNSTLESGTGMVMFYLNTPVLSKGWVKLSKGTEAKLHFHDNITEEFIVIHGSLGYTRYDKGGVTEIDTGTLQPRESVTFKPYEWHVIYTALEDTYLDIIITKIPEKDIDLT